MDNDNFREMQAKCAPMQIIVTSVTEDDKYYIHFDGSKTYPNREDWEKYFFNFAAHVKFLLRSNGFRDDQVRCNDGVYAVAYIGTLFEMLAKIHE